MADRLKVGAWRADRARCIVESEGVVRDLEPKVVDLLFMLAAQPGEVVSRERIFASLWPGVVVGQDSLSACVAKLRAALGDNARAPRIIQTVPKRGYRLIAPVTAPDEEPPSSDRPRFLHARLAVAAAAAALAPALIVYVATGWSTTASAEAVQLTRRAHDHYFQFNRGDNEAAIKLYERAIRDEPRHGAAYAGLANALVQRVVRWPEPPGAAEPSQPSLYEAVANGRTRTPFARAKLDRALSLAEAGVRMAPSIPATHKALGLVLGARGEIQASQRSFERAVATDPDAWDALLNLGEIEDRLGKPSKALIRFEEAYSAMTRVYDAQPVRLRTWYPATGVSIASRYAAAGRFADAAGWYRRVLDHSPFHGSATAGLAQMLVRLGKNGEAAQLCAELMERVGGIDKPCQEIPPLHASAPSVQIAAGGMHAL